MSFNTSFEVTAMQAVTLIKLSYYNNFQSHITLMLLSKLLIIPCFKNDTKFKKAVN